MSNTLRLPIISGAALSSLALALLALVSPGGARAQCSPSNPTNWCADQDAPGVTDAAEPLERFGAALAFGDFNGDGFDDLAVGVPNEEEVGAVHVFYSNGGALSLAGQQFFSQNNVGGADQGAETGDEFGFALAAGRFNTDGIDDLAVSSPGEDLPDGPSNNCTFATCQDAGLVHIIPGSANGLSLAGSFVFESGLGDNLRFGHHLARGRFFSGIFDDLLIAIDAGDGSGSPAEVVIAFFGSAGGLTTTGASLRSESGPPEDQGFGFALAVGDFAAQGRDNVAVGAAERGAGGRVFAEFTFQQATSNFPATTLAEGDFPPSGEGASDAFGSAVTAADFDDDGFDDLAIGAPGNNHGAGDPDDSGRVYVGYGSATGLDPSAAGFLIDIIGEDEWSGQTPAAGERFGTALAAGDLDSDVFDDLLMGAPGEGADGGFLFLKKGSATGLTTAGNQVISQGFIGGVTDAGDRFGSVLAVGDVNGDGIDEVAIGVPDKNVGTHTDAGMVYVSHVFDPQWIFSDGFESGDTTAWSQVVQ